MNILSLRTDVPGLILNQNMRSVSADMANVMNQLSTGLRINTAKDDPAGLVGSEILRSNMAATETALKNVNIGEKTLATADSALSEMNKLLIEAKRIVTDTQTGVDPGDTATLSANQKTFNGIVDSLNRIATATEFNGIKLLDGTFDKIYQLGATATPANQVNVKISNMTTSASGLGLDNYKDYLVSADGTAHADIPGALQNMATQVETALSKVLNERATVGSTQKYTFESFANVLDGQLTNLTAAESDIRDVDVGKAELQLVQDQLLLSNAAVLSSIASQRRSFISALVGA